uniref:Flowering time control protein FCA n=1 Tax=Ananas comosus var. bracteatus TaxID=296719 RepID=A0A6V7PLV2_ANACO|nr:unnamed protein product [Ananas comosus var. bracteatus]
MDRHRGDRAGDGPRHSKAPSRWSSSGSPTNQSHRYPRGGGGGGGNGGGVGEGFSSSGPGGGGGGGRYHPYRGPQEYPPPGGGGGRFRGGGGGGGPGASPGGFGAPPMQMPGARHGFSGRGGSPDHNDGSHFVKLFIGSVPRTATEEEIRPLFEEHGDVIEVALIKDKKTGQQQGCCFVKYATLEEADRAIRALHNQVTLPGGIGPIQVRYADGERERHGSVEHKLFVASLNKHASAKEIEEANVYIMRDAMRQSRGCGFVKFSTREMAAAAMNALNGTYIMRGCDQPLIVRFADPKRPRPGEQRGGPTFGGPGFSPRSDAALVIRPTANLDEPRGGGRMPPDSWRPLSPQSLGPSSQLNNSGSNSHANAKGGPATTSSDNSAGVFGPSGFPANGSLPSHSAAPSFPQLGFNPTMGQVRPMIGQQISPLQKPFMSPQNFPHPLQFHNAQQMPAMLSQAQNLQEPMQQLQLQNPQSIGVSSFGQTLTPQQLPLGGQFPASQPLIQQNPSAGAMQNPLAVQQQQAMPGVPSQQQFPPNITPQLLQQQPMQQLPSQLPQVLLQQQAQALQSSYQSSQQAILQLQQQLQLMQQQQSLNQQQVAQAAAKQQVMHTRKAASTTPASVPAAVMPTVTSATSALPVNAAPAVPLTCNWTEHTSPEGFKYYYNSITRESKWEKPEEFALFEQQQQQQKMLLLQQQQKLAVQQLQSPPHAQAHAQVQPNQQIPQTQQAQPMQMRQQPQLQLVQPSIMHQAAVAGQQNIQDPNYAQLQAANSAIDPTRVQQVLWLQSAQEWAWKNKPAGL